ncbi:hypothetical protein PanWU01x14_254060 [Parasponia andersonii]|uniref:Uncharacterized protein n=1 Tax=Parasponia andersonii TaxID=3476 RepID=A0A2P5BBB0_PARAD|nr:hypothetical protein PanWU01x14_254060 [Parasponia andersonii]
MEDSHNDSRSVCEKIFCCIFPTSQETSHSHLKQYHLPASQPSYLSEQEYYKQHTEKYKPKFEQPAKAITGERLPFADSDVERYVQKQGQRSGSDINEAFSDYINRAKFKIRAMSNVGGGDHRETTSNEDEVYDAEKKADANDVFVDYINRAKLKISKTSSIGSKRMISF